MPFARGYKPTANSTILHTNKSPEELRQQDIGRVNESFDKTENHPGLPKMAGEIFP
jgi:hypothetical protein